jgi:hypothetical protein
MQNSQWQKKKELSAISRQLSAEAVGPPVRSGESEIPNPQSEIRNRRIVPYTSVL